MDQSPLRGRWDAFDPTPISGALTQLSRRSSLAASRRGRRKARGSCWPRRGSRSERRGGGGRAGYGGGGGAAPRVSRGGGAEAVIVELEEIVGCCDEPPFRPTGLSAAALEGSDLAVELQLAEDGLDGDLPGPVGGAPDGRGEHAAHEVIEAAGPSRPRRRAQPGVGWTRTWMPSLTTVSIWRWCQ